MKINTRYCLSHLLQISFIEREREGGRKRQEIRKEGGKHSEKDREERRKEAGETERGRRGGSVES